MSFDLIRPLKIAASAFVKSCLANNMTRVYATNVHNFGIEAMYTYGYGAKCDLNDHTWWFIDYHCARLVYGWQKSLYAGRQRVLVILKNTGVGFWQDAVNSTNFVLAPLFC